MIDKETRRTPAEFGADVAERAAQIETIYGDDVEEALSRWELAGGQRAEAYSLAWLSVAFLFSRRRRTSL